MSVSELGLPCLNRPRAKRPYSVTSVACDVNGAKEEGGQRRERERALRKRTRKKEVGEQGILGGAAAVAAAVVFRQTSV